MGCPVTQLENVYGMDETGVILLMLNSVKAVVRDDDTRNYSGTGVKGTMATVFECISAHDRALLPLIIWTALTRQSNWTKYPTSGRHIGTSRYYKDRI
ncbi:uncharacterized protein BDR25DRAFT_243683 [Lindgomyces ingoldianus]|uniref:Uncharacterized protein n=1 Tax=Lindgomyces ingoldianus TaxID=673940 RepID=A0ACB6QAN9_9PLEO|nr:uncharacterized protein BDR25DRAFT_243683 [Lindgomyces ingoldianus]KAF2463998.1 hypothetical protein BDR25DRAFT_243683 [Lindgomyces ingoldianus]